jgi:hypothetical protein
MRVLSVLLIGVALLVMCDPVVAQSAAAADVERVFGNCAGRILITPTRLNTNTGRIESKLVTYDCRKKQFSVLAASDAPRVLFSDLTAQGDGYYFAFGEVVDGVLHGQFRGIDRVGKVVLLLDRVHLDTHDVVFDGRQRVYMRYVPDAKHASCSKPAPLDFEVVSEDSAGHIDWSWSSKGRIKSSYSVATPATIRIEPTPAWKRALRPLRHCLTVALASIVNMDLPRYTWLSSSSPTLLFDYDDYVHANSLQLLPNGNVLVSARHLDSVFEIDRNTNRIAWAVVGPKAKMKGMRIIGDPLQGFSHQHAATLYPNDLLVVFDNGNLLDRPSRAVVYQLDHQQGTARFVAQFVEPNQRSRPATGSAYLLDREHLIIGWGYVSFKDRSTAQRAVSIVNLSSGKEEFGIDFRSGYHSYRAKWGPEIN